VDIQQPSRIVTPVYFRPGQFTFPKSAIIELTADEKVLVTTHKDTERQEVVINVPLSSIKRLRVFRGSLMRLKIDRHTYWIDVNTSHLKQSLPETMQGADAWIEFFRSKNIPVWNMTYKKIMILVSSISLTISILIQIIVWFS